MSNSDFLLLSAPRCHPHVIEGKRGEQPRGLKDERRQISQDTHTQCGKVRSRRLQHVFPGRRPLLRSFPSPLFSFHPIVFSPALPFLVLFSLYPPVRIFTVITIVTAVTVDSDGCHYGEQSQQLCFRSFPVAFALHCRTAPHLPPQYDPSSWPAPALLLPSRLLTPSFSFGFVVIFGICVLSLWVWAWVALALTWLWPPSL